MGKIEWCVHKKDGIELVEPNENLRNAYLLKAEEALEASRAAISKDWQLTAAYYTIYSSLG